MVTPQADNSLSITVYCKPTHSDQSLQWDSNHNLSAKYSVIGTLTHRANTVCTIPKLLNEELEHLREALVRCKNPGLAINKIQNQYNNYNWEQNGNNTNQGEDSTLGPNRVTCREVNNNNNRPNAGQIVVPYVQGLGKNLKKTCSRYGVHTLQGKYYHKMLVRPKDKDPKDCQSNVTYSYQCKEVDCNEEYIGKTSRTLGERYRELLKEPSPTHVHSIQTA